MKLINFKNVQEFNTLRQKMNASYVNWSSISWEERQKAEIEIKIDNGEYITNNLDEITIGKDGILEHDGKAIIVYIPAGSGYKFHFAHCKTLESMKEQGRYDRYALTRRTDGQFQVNTASGVTYHRLSACQNCLNMLGYPITSTNIHHFNIKNHFDKYHPKPSQRIHTPKYTDKNAPIDAYTKDFDEISRKKREKDGFICSECHINLSQHPQYLHVHHINGVKQDNSEANLRTLCVSCHAKQPHHSHMIIPSGFFLIQRNPIYYKK